MSEILVDAGLEIIGIILSLIIGWLSYQAQNWLKVEKNRKQLASVEKYAYLAVLAVEQVLTDYDSKTKFDTAKKDLIGWAEKNSIPLDERDLVVLVESAVKKVKDEGKEVKQVYEGIDSDE